MALNVNNPEADRLTRKFAKMAGVSITDTIVIAMKKAIERRRNLETPLETAKRLRAKHGVMLNGQAGNPSPEGCTSCKFPATLGLHHISGSFIVR